MPMNMSTESNKVWSVRLLLFIAGLGGLLYGIDIGIIAGALPYLQATAISAWNLSSQQISYVVAAVLLGSVLSSLFAGMLSDLFGRRAIMFASGLCFVASIPIIALASGYVPLLLGRLLQGISGGLIGVVVPLYLAECLPASNRGRGTAIFQWLLTMGLVVAALIGLYYASSVESIVEATKNAVDAAARVLAAKDHAWRSIFWMSITPGIIFTIGTLMIAESPRWLFRRGKKDASLAALLRTRTAAEAQVEISEMEETARAADGQAQAKHGDSLLSRRYVLPFFIACIILACNQATGVNSILSYIVNILNEAGLPGSVANWGDVSLKVLNCLMTIVAVILVDKKGRKFLLMLGSAGIVICLAVAGGLFLTAERSRGEYKSAVQAMVKDDSLNFTVDDEFVAAVAASLANQPAGSEGRAKRPMQLTIAYAYGPFTNVQSRRTDDPAKAPVIITRQNTVQPESVVEAFFRRIHLNPFADPKDGQSAPLRIKKAAIGPVPDEGHGWLVAAFLFGFMAFFAVGPGVCVWLALSELMPTRIRSNGMSIALLINQFVSTTIAAVFLPTVGNYGYATMFFLWSGCTVIYFLTATFLLPETKGKTLEEIDEYFMGRKTS
jgi:MFS transporter, SP family, solute carrier family 2 (myo-inositol transporter), member 13